MQRLELPHNHKGEVDWNTLGNILSANILGEVLCASYVDHKHGKQQSFRADTDWEFAYEEHNVIVLKKKMEDSPISVFMGRGVIDRPMEEVVQFVGSMQSRPLWDSLLVEIKIVKRLSNTDVIVYMHHQATRCLVKQVRDFLYYERMAHVEGKYVQTAMSVDLPDCPPTNITRAQIRPGSGWVIEPYEGDRTLVSYCAHVDLQSLPPVIMNRVLRRQPMAIRYIRRILMDPVKRRSFEESCDSSVMFTASDQHAVEELTTSRGYEDRVSLEAFTGKKPSPPVWRKVHEGSTAAAPQPRQQAVEVEQDDPDGGGVDGEGEKLPDFTEASLSVAREQVDDVTVEQVALESGAMCTGSACVLPLFSIGFVPVSSDLEASCQSELSPDQCQSLPTLSIAAANARLKAEAVLSKAHSTHAVHKEATTIRSFEEEKDSSSESSRESFHTASGEVVGTNDCCDGDTPRSGFQSTGDSTGSSPEKGSGYPSGINTGGDKQGDHGRDRLGTALFDITVSL